MRKALLTQVEDTNKVHLLAQLSSMYAVSQADSGVVYAQQALNLAKKLNFEEGILEAEGSISVSLLSTGNYPLSLDHGFKALSLARKINPVEIPFTYSLVLYSYYYMGEYETALKYTLEATKLAASWELPYGWRDLSIVYHSLNKHDSAMYFAKKAYADLKGTDAEGNICDVLGDAYAGLGNYDSALFFYRHGESYSQQNNTELFLIDNFNGIAGVYKSIEKLDSAAWYSKRVLDEKIEKRYPLGLLKAANMLADIYVIQNKPDSALKYLRMALNIKDSLFSREKTMAIQNLAFKEEEKRKEVEAAKLQSQNRLKIYALLGGLFTVLIAAALLFKNNRQKAKANEKIEKAYGELKSAQAQLIQSEKMASLGELTAGIAHEIQNPLNFMNNFSEVNKELLVELRDEMDKGHADEVKSIAKNVMENEEKINHHGKRADAIIKGMLQHSRESTGQKEPADINALADEYLRLSYHGLRSKDKSFNATLKTNFDASIGNVNIIPQDIGRVLLNLYNNAFYAVAEKAKLSGGEYKPTIKVETRQTFPPPGGSRGAIIRISDNGDGIPQKILDKIFQPFFTTKPTGQGTGLGLSLSYDIVKAHGGEITVKTKEGEGTEFIIQLPIV